MAAYVAIAISILFTLGAMILCALHVSEPISGLTRTMGVFASGDVAQEVPYRMRRDEIGAMARAVQVFKHNPIRTGPLEGETVETRFAIEEQRKTCRRQMAGTFEGAVGGIIGMVSSAATELQATARTMTATATETASQSTTVAAAAGEAAVNVGTVAAAAEQLGASVQEIGRQVQGSTSLAQEAVGEATQTAPWSSNSAKPPSASATWWA